MHTFVLRSSSSYVLITTGLPNGKNAEIKEATDFSLVSKNANIEKLASLSMTQEKLNCTQSQVFSSIVLETLWRIQKYTLFVATKRCIPRIFLISNFIILSFILLNPVKTRGLGCQIFTICIDISS
jgi:hypothetical protein